YKEFEDGLLKLKNNAGKELFYIVMAYSGLYMILCIIISIGLFYVKDINKYGVKVNILIIILYYDDDDFIILII
ncbi:hypothetical protein BCR36DRAFT_303978, partial [Piromyces finnis]